MSWRAPILDWYIFRQTAGTLAVIVGIVMSLMVLEHLPRLLEVTRLSGHRGYIVMQTVAGLVPEYVGIGLLVGLYLAIALTVRRLVLRGELDAIEASGVGPLRWMRIPGAMSLAIAALTLANQGWIMPSGEARLAEIGSRVAAGDFGYNLRAGEFIDLGSDHMLLFDSVESETGYLTGLLLRSEDRTLSAAKGRLSVAPDGETMIQLFDGQSIGGKDGRVLSFHSMIYRTDKPGSAATPEVHASDRLRLVPLDELISSTNRLEQSAAYARLLWPLLVLLMPVLAFVFGKPPNRSSSAMGMLVGLALVVTCVKAIAAVSESHLPMPGALAAGVALSWVFIAAALLKLDRQHGRGFLERGIADLVGRGDRTPARNPKVVGNAMSGDPVLGSCADNQAKSPNQRIKAVAT